MRCVHLTRERCNLGVHVYTQDFTKGAGFEGGRSCRNLPKGGRAGRSGVEVPRIGSRAKPRYVSLWTRSWSKICNYCTIFKRSLVENLRFCGERQSRDSIFRGKIWRCIGSLNPRALSRYASGRPWDEFYSFLSFAGSNDVTAFILTITRVEIARQASRLQLTVRQRFKHADPTSGWLAGKKWSW